jgi:hypothetical protein
MEDYMYYPQRIFSCMVTVVVVLLSSMVTATPVKHEIQKYSTSILLNGVITEWTSKDAKVWENKNGWFWDAMNTPEGLAGYIRIDTAIQCTSLAFAIESRGTLIPVSPRWPAEASMASVYCAEKSVVNGQSRLIIEWILPWNLLRFDTTGAYAITINETGGCVDSLQPLLLTGSKQKPQTVFTSGVKTQIVLISILLVIYFGVRLMTDRQTRRRKSLRQ